MDRTPRPQGAAKGQCGAQADRDPGCAVPAVGQDEARSQLPPGWLAGKKLPDLGIPGASPEAERDQGSGRWGCSFGGGAWDEARPWRQTGRLVTPQHPEILLLFSPTGSSWWWLSPSAPPGGPGLQTPESC